eukprot:357612-Amorphochlora_amoeboformis.AAC.1
MVQTRRNKRKRDQNKDEKLEHAAGKGEGGETRGLGAKKSKKTKKTKEMPMRRRRAKRRGKK